MRILILILLSFSAAGQQIIYQGNPSTITGFKGGVLADSGYYFPQLKTSGTDTSLVGADATSRGKNIKITKSMIQRWAIAGIPAVTLQQAISNGNDLDQDNNIVFGSNSLTFTGRYLALDNDSLTSVSLIDYTENRRNEYQERTLPDWGNVKDTVSAAVEGLRSIVDQNEQAALDSISALRNLITNISFDTTFSITSNTITSARFSGRQVVSILFDTGISYNSAWFTKVGTTVTLLNELKAIAGRKATITLR